MAVPECELVGKRVVIVGHITEVYGPVQALSNYLTSRTDEFVSILHPFSYSSVPDSAYRVHSKRECRESLRWRNIRFSEVLSYAQHIALTLYWILRSRKRFSIYVGIDNLNAFTGIVLRKLGVTDKVIFYVIDYTPKRFRNTFINLLYHALDGFCVRHSDYVWNISERIAEVREKQGVSKTKNLVVPVGIELEKIGCLANRKGNKRKLVFVSHLTKSKGVELAIEAMKAINQAVPDAILEIIGTGPHEQELEKMCEVRGLSNYVKFLGAMGHDKLLEYLPSCGIALATYLDDLDSITYYADPTKPKEYLACGLPVVITRVPWIAEEIERRPMGIAIRYTKEELTNAVIKLAKNNDFYMQCSKNATAFTSNLSWDKIYTRAFKETCGERSDHTHQGI